MVRKSRKPTGVPAAVFGLLATTVLVVASCTGDNMFTPDVERAPVSIQLTPSQITFTSLGDTASIRNVPGGAITWSVADPGVATVSSSGKVRAVSSGSTYVRGHNGNSTDSVKVHVTQQPATITVSPGSQTLNGLGAQARLSAVVLDEGGSVVKNASVSWRADNAAVIGVNNSGHVTAVGQGSTYAVAVSGATSDSAAITVVQDVTTISIQSAGVSLAVGDSVTLSVTVLDASGAVVDSAPLAWSSSNPGVATVTNGTVKGVAAGTAQVTATSGTASSSVTVTVTALSTAPAPVASVTVSPSSSSIQQGATVQLAATTKDASGTVVTGRTITWSSSDAGIATVSSTGFVTAVAAGSAIITATSEGVNGAAAVGVTVPAQAPAASITIAPADATAQVGGTVQLTATLKDANGNVLTGRTITWASLAPAIATVSAAGLITGVSAGTAAITASADAQTATAQVTISAPPTSSVSGGSMHEPADMTTFVAMDGSVRTPAGWTATDAWTGANGWRDATTAVVPDGSNPTGSGYAIEKRWYGPESVTAGSGATASSVPCTLKYGSSRPEAYKGRMLVAGGDTVQITDYTSGALTLASPLSSVPAAGGAITVLGSGTDAASHTGVLGVWHWLTLDPAFTPAKTLYIRMRVWFSSNWPDTDPNLAGMKFFYLRTSETTHNVLFTSNGGSRFWQTYWATLTSNGAAGHINYDTWSPTANLAPKGNWHTVEFLFVTNSAVGVADGSVTLWVDGALATQTTGVEFIAADDSDKTNDFDGLEFYNLRGGAHHYFDRDDTFRLGELYVSGK